MEDISIGIDLGGSHVAIGVVSKNGKIIEQFEKDFTIKEKIELIKVAVNFIVKKITYLQKKYSFTNFGIGIPGTIFNGIVLKSVNLRVRKL